MFYDISDVDHLAGDPVSQPVWSLPVVTDSPGTACNFGQCHKRSPAKSSLHPSGNSACNLFKYFLSLLQMQNVDCSLVTVIKV